MKYYSSFGGLLRSLRRERHLTQSQVCSGICDRRTYVRWEKDETEVSLYYLYQLSNRFSYDLLASYRLFICNDTMQTWLFKKQLDEYYNLDNWDAILSLLDKKEKNKTNSVEIKQVILCYRASYSYKQKDYINSIRFCILALQLEDESITEQKPFGNIYSNIGFNLQNILALNNVRLNKYQQCIDMYIHMIKQVEDKMIPGVTSYQSHNFDIKFHQKFSLNLIIETSKHGDLEYALSTAEKAVHFSLQHNYIGDLPRLVRQKIKIYYLMKNYEQSKINYDICYGLYKIIEDSKELEKFISNSKTCYPLLFNTER